MNPKHLSKYHSEKLKESLEYLRSRGKYILDGKFKPTNSNATDVAATIKKYRTEMEKSKKSGETKTSKFPVAIIYPKTIANP